MQRSVVPVLPAGAGAMALLGLISRAGAQKPSGQEAGSGPLATLTAWAQQQLQFQGVAGGLSAVLVALAAVLLLQRLMASTLKSKPTKPTVAPLPKEVRRAQVRGLLVCRAAGRYAHPCTRAQRWCFAWATRRLSRSCR